MRRIDHELATEQFLLFETIGHGVERGGEGLDLARAGLGDTDGEIAGGDLAGPAGHQLDGAGDHPRKDRRHDDGDGRGNPERHAEHHGHAGIEHRVGVLGSVTRSDHQGRE